MKQKYSEFNQLQLEKLAANIASKTTLPTLITLQGDLGAGKTTFARSFIRELMKDQNCVVTSPTFNLLQTYKISNSEHEIWHYDLYRIEDELELEELGLDEALSHHITLIEWPEIAEHYIADIKNRIDIKIISNQNTRDIEIYG